MRRKRKNSRTLKVFLLKIVLFLFLVTVIPIVLMRWFHPPVSSFMLQRKIHAFQKKEKNFELHYSWKNRDKISPYLFIAVIASEDQKFPDHWGFDFDSIADALREHAEGAGIRGASTISQQVAKNLFLWPGKSLFRKVIEAYFTLLIEIFWPKIRILEVYVNIAQFGDSVFGVEEAGKKYFGKPSLKLGRSESALLAAVLPSPNRLHADNPSSYLRMRKVWILKQMTQLGGTRFLKNL